MVGQQQIESLPINGRNFMSFSVITPGVSLDNTPQQGASATSGLSFTGQRARSNNIMVDGLDNNDPIVGSVRATFSQEAVREFQVLTNSYSAEFGKASGGVVNIVTKSGTNELSGNVFVFVRDDALNAKDHFEKFDVFGGAIDRDKAPYKQWQYGATLGGPIRKDKTFFFLSFERLDIEANNFVTISDADAAILQRAGFPVQTGANPYEFKDTLLLGKINHYWSPEPQPRPARQLFRPHEREHRALRRAHRAQPRAPSSSGPTTASRLAQTDILSSRWLNEARVQWAHEDQDINSLDPNCGGTLHRRSTRAGRRSRWRAWPAWAGSASRPSRGTNDRIQVTDTLSYATGQPFREGRLRFQLHRQPRHRAAAALRRPLPLPSSARDPGPVADAALRHPGGGGGDPRRLHPGLRDSGRTVFGTGTSRCSCRTSGASRAS